jgi:C-terminal processing protease CtpA/Prc
MNDATAASLALTVALACGACASASLPREAPPLVRMEEPLEWMREPDDEAARRALPKGSFTGLVVGDARATLEEMLGEPRGVLVAAVVENSPGAAAGVEAGDVLVAASAGERTLELHWPAEWRRLEDELEPGAEMRLVVDRAGAELDLALVTEARVAPRERLASQRFREEQRVGLVVRTATEVEARAAGLGAGGGAVVVGLTLESPWRGLVVYRDLIRAVDGAEVAHPQVVLDRIREAPERAALRLELVRGGAPLTVDAPLSRREQRVREVSVPLLFTFERERDASRLSVLLGLVAWQRTPAAWRLRLAWLFTLSGGDSDRLEVIER